MSVYEYTTMESALTPHDNLIKALDMMGKSGWIMCGSCETGIGRRMFWFYREVKS